MFHHLTQSVMFCILKILNNVIYYFMSSFADLEVESRSFVFVAAGR